MTEVNDAHGDTQSRFVHESGAFVAQAQAAKALEPGEGAFDHVAIRAQAAAVRCALFGQEGNDAACPQPIPMCPAVVAPITEQRLRFVFGVAWLACHWGQRLDKRSPSWVTSWRLAAVA